MTDQITRALASHLGRYVQCQAYGVPPTESDRDAALAVLMMVGVVPELPRDHDELLTRIRAELMESKSSHAAPTE